VAVTVTTDVAQRAPARIERLPDPCAMVIFGASGDLTRRKLMPALYTLKQEKFLPDGFCVVGFSRTDMSHDEFRSVMHSSVGQFSDSPVDQQSWDNFAQHLFYLPAHVAHPEDYVKLRSFLDQLDREHGTVGNRLYYLAVPPSQIEGIVGHLARTGLARPERGWTRIIVEKPFGTDLSSAQQLNRELKQFFHEQQIYRIDHYLGKETVQNLLVFRFANGIFEPVWNRRYVAHVQITAAETLGVGTRASYYEEAGALRDMVQNHMLQLLSLTAMEPPVTFGQDSVREEKTKVLRAIRPVPLDRLDEFVVRGQYGPGAVDGNKVPGYREEPGVAPDSSTETYVALKLYIENWRWAGVPFYIRAGKRLARHVTEVAIQFKQPPLLLFEKTPAAEVEPNLLAVRIQPDEGISLKFAAKLPGPSIRISDVNMDFKYASAFGMASANAYERLLLDCMLGDATLFARDDAVELSWALVTPILEAWKKTPPPRFPNYDSGSWGPLEADRLIAPECCGWRQP
jgi:glucose-6-phosphate 1-dehydrogenase